MKGLHLIFIYLIISFFQCKVDDSNLVFQSSHLNIEKVGNHTYRHISYLETESYGKFPCNGMIVINDQEAFIVDSPADKMASEELINWLSNEKQLSILGVLATHFHVDCVGGLEVFHKHGIQSYATNQTINLVKTNQEFVVPMNGFDREFSIEIGETKLISSYFGPGHTADNIVSFYEEDQVLFGGCLIKAIGSGKGNLNDANTKEWSNTVKSVKKRYPEVKHVIPGHGKSGDSKLFDYTIEKFKID